VVDRAAGDPRQALPHYAKAEEPSDAHTAPHRQPILRSHQQQQLSPIGAAADSTFTSSSPAPQTVLAASPEAARRATASQHRPAGNGEPFVSGAPLGASLSAAAEAAGLLRSQVGSRRSSVGSTASSNGAVGAVPSRHTDSAAPRSGRETAGSQLPASGAAPAPVAVSAAQRQPFAPGGSVGDASAADATASVEAASAAAAAEGDTTTLLRLVGQMSHEVRSQQAVIVALLQRLAGYEEVPAEALSQSVQLLVEASQSGEGAEEGWGADGDGMRRAGVTAGAQGAGATQGGSAVAALRSRRSSVSSQRSAFDGASAASPPPPGASQRRGSSASARAAPGRAISRSPSPVAPAAPSASPSQRRGSVASTRSAGAGGSSATTRRASLQAGSPPSPAVALASAVLHSPPAQQQQGRRSSGSSGAVAGASQQEAAAEPAGARIAALEEQQASLLLLVSDLRSAAARDASRIELLVSALMEQVQGQQDRSRAALSATGTSATQDTFSTH